MSDKFAHLPVTLAALLRKLADNRFSVLDCVSERLDWVKAGCPVSQPVVTRERGPLLPEGGIDHGMLG